MSILRTQIHKGHAAFEELKPHWLKLQKVEGTLPFIQFHWCEKQAGYVAEPVILSIWADDECVAILPLAKKVVIPKLRIEGLVHLCQRFTDYQSILSSPKFPLSECLDAIFTTLSASEFKSLPILFHYPDAHLTSILVSSAKRFGRIKKFNRWEHVSYQNKLAPVKKKVIADASRRRKKLEEKGNLVVNINLGYDPKTIDWILNNNAAKHGENSLTAHHDRESVHALLQHSENVLHVASIKMDDQIIAAHLGFNVNSCLYYYVPVINPEFRQYSPGMIMLEQIYSNFETLKVTKVDFLRGDEAYKYKWGNKKQKKFSLCCLPHKVNPIRDTAFTWWLKRNQ